MQIELALPRHHVPTRLRPPLSINQPVSRGILGMEIMPRTTADGMGITPRAYYRLPENQAKKKNNGVKITPKQYRRREIHIINTRPTA